jgi:hypothetical protein
VDYGEILRKLNEDRRKVLSKCGNAELHKKLLQSVKKEP